MCLSDFYTRINKVIEVPGEREWLGDAPLFLRFYKRNYTATVIPRCEAGRINNALVRSHLEAKQRSGGGGLRELERRAQAPAPISAAWCRQHRRRRRRRRRGRRSEQGNRLAEARSSQSLLWASRSSFSLLCLSLSLSLSLCLSLSHSGFPTLLPELIKSDRGGWGASLAPTPPAPCCPGEGISLFWWRMRPRANPRVWGPGWPTTPSSPPCCAPVLTCCPTAPSTGWAASSIPNGRRWSWTKRSLFTTCATWGAWSPSRRRETAAPRRRWPRSGRGATTGSRVSRWG